MTANDPIEWILKDTDLSTDLGIMPLGPSKLYLQLNEPGSGEVKVPGASRAAQMAASQMFLEGLYRGATRGGFFVENLSQVDADSSEGAGQWLSMTGRGALAILEDAIVWTDGTSKTKRTFDSATKASILIDLIEEAKARGCFADISYDFSATQDSLGNYWTDTIVLELSVGTSLLEVVRDFSSMGMDFEMLVTGGGYLLKAYRDGKGSDKSSSIYFRVGTNCEEVSRQELGGGIKNALLVRYEDGYTRVYDTPSITARRRREKLLEADYAGNSSIAATFGRAELEQVADPQKSIAVKIYDGIGPRAFVDYDLGDYIMLDVRGTETKYRIRGLQLEWNGGKVADVIVDLNSTIMENELKMAKDIRDLQDRWASAHDAGALDATFWAAVGEANDAVSISCIFVDGSLVYVGGKFAQMGNVAANNIAVYNIDSSSWSALGDGLNDECYDIVVIGSNVYACGKFNEAGGVSATHVAVWNGTSWAAMGSGISSNYPYSMAALGTDLLVAGNITTGTGWVVKRWNGSAWSTLGAEVSSRIYVVRVNGSDVYIGGEFNTSGLTYLYGVAKLVGSSWQALGDGAKGIVRAIAFIGSNVYIGGDFTKVSDGPGDYVAVWDGSAWSELGNGVDGTVRALAASTVDIFVGGDFLNASGVPVNYTAKYNGESWEALSTGLNGSVYCMSIYNMMDIYVGGSFTLADETPAHMIAAYLTTFESIMDYMENASGYRHPNHSGHVHSVGDGATTIQPNVVANTMLADMDASTIKGRPQGAGTGDPVDLTPAQSRKAILPDYSANAGKILAVNATADDTEWVEGGGGGGDVVGPASAVDNHIVLYDGTTGKLIKDSGKTLSDYVAIALAVTGRMLITDASGNVTTVDNLIYDLTNKIMVQGATSAVIGGANSQELIGDGASAGKIIASFGTAVNGFLAFVRGRGTKASPSAIQSGDVIGAVRGRAYYSTGSSLSNTQVDIEMIATENWSTTARGCKIVISTTPNGSTTKTVVLTIDQDGNVNIPSGTYNINGSPHTHSYAPTSAQYLTLATDATLSSERVLTAGINLALTDGGAGGAATLDMVMQSATVFHDTTQTIATGSWTTVALDNEVSDPQGWHDTVTNNSRIYVPAGEYQVLIQNMNFASNSTGLRGVLVKDSDGNVWGENMVTALNGNYTPVPLATQRTISGSGKYIYLQVYQSSGGNLNLNAYCKVTVNRLK